MKTRKQFLGAASAIATAKSLLQPEQSRREYEEQPLRAVAAFRDVDNAFVMQAEGTPDFVDMCYEESDFTQNILSYHPELRPSAGVWVWEGKFLPERPAFIMSEVDVDSYEPRVEGAWRLPDKAELRALELGQALWKEPSEAEWVVVRDYLTHGDPLEAGSELIRKLAEAKKLHCLGHLDFRETNPAYLIPSFVGSLFVGLDAIGGAEAYQERLRNAQVITDFDWQQEHLESWLADFRFEPDDFQFERDTRA